MSLRRTRSGLLSLHRFLGCDVVVYCEGGPNAIPVTNSPQMGSTLDTYYWSVVVSKLNIGKNYHFKSVGSKSTLLQIAADITARNIATVTICVDADYDPLLGQVPETARTCRTLGYSWENDVLSEDVFIEIVGNMIGLGQLQTVALGQARLEMQQLRSVMAKWTEIDAALKKRGKKCVFNRKKPTDCLDYQRHPRIRESALQAKLTGLGYKRGPRIVAKVQAGQAFESCFGKILSRNLFHYANKIFESFNVAKISYEVFMRQAIAATSRGFAAAFGGRLEQHHQAQRVHFA